MTPVFYCVGHEWVTPGGSIRPADGLIVPPDRLPRDHNWSRGELEAVPSGDPPNDLLHRNLETLRCGTAVDDDGKNGAGTAAASVDGGCD
jgi:hypothetical protein